VAPGLKGGSYRPLGERDLLRIHETALDVLENIGIGGALPEILDLALPRGCRLNDAGRLCFPRGFVEDAIAGACHGFTLHAPDPDLGIELGGTRVHYATSGEAVTVYEPETRPYRHSPLRALYDMESLVDQLGNIHRFCQTVIATDIADPFGHNMNIAYAILAGTRKSFSVSFARPEDIEPATRLFDLALGEEGAFLARPFCTIGCCPIVSPLRFGEEACRVALESVRLGIPGDFAVAPQAGATAPAALAGTLVQVTAETLSTVLLTNLAAPGHPTVYAAWPFVSDLRTGAFSGGSGEEALLSAAAVQLGNFYDLPTSVAAGMSDSKLPDNQAGFEKGLSTALAGLAGANYVGEAAGMQASLMGCSFEALVIDNDMLGAVQRAIRGIEVTDETLSYEVIEAAALGPGHYLGTDQTLAMMESEYLYPEVADRRTYGEWQDSGSPDIREAAVARAREILSNHYPAYIDPAADERIREQFPIALPREALRPG
jgi:trimethylamine--corrinoid protein Co-methyltransferase